MRMSSIFVAMAVVALAWAQAGAARADEPGYLGKASAYCTAKGGVVQEREPYYGTNGNSPLQLAGKQYFCQFTKKDGSQISLLLSTMWTKMPSLAALAYYAEVQYNDNCNGSPGSCYCSQLGGTDLFGGVTGAGGGWVLTTNANDVLDTCIFPDMSSIDSYGLFYHSADIIRGKNLATVLRYKNPY